MTRYLIAALDGYDCETCGYSYDEIEISESEDGGPGLYDLMYRAGCYGGFTKFDIDEGDLLDELKAIETSREGRDDHLVRHLIRRFRRREWDGEE